MTANSIRDLEPRLLWHYFAEISAIPRPSKHEQGLIDYISAWADKYAVVFKQDQIGNVILSKSATSGREAQRGIVLQAHLDMVTQKRPSVVHDFYADGINLVVDNGWVRAEGTTLGADNGMGVAAILAAFSAPGLCHGPLEALLTIDEEAGMSGAKSLQPGCFKGDILLNLDSEQNGDVYIGCAGGVDVDVNIALDTLPLMSDEVAFRLSVFGLRGGHSGLDINRGRANAIFLAVGFLCGLIEAAGVPARLIQLESGSARNAIPRDADLVFAVPAIDSEALQRWFADYSGEQHQYFQSVEPDVEFALVECSQDSGALAASANRTFLVLSSVYAVINGVQRMAVDFQDVVETSSNLSIARVESGTLKLSFLVRSLSDQARDQTAQRIRAHFAALTRDVSLGGCYPGWQPVVNSTLLEAFKGLYQREFGHQPVVKVIHAGLECGLLGAVYPQWQMLSFGPTILYPHSPEEKVEIRSVGLFWQLLQQLLTHLPDCPVSNRP